MTALPAIELVAAVAADPMRHTHRREVDALVFGVLTRRRLWFRKETVKEAAKEIHGLAGRFSVTTIVIRPVAR